LKRALDLSLGLREKGLTSVVLVSLGYRSESDFNAALPKSRLPRDFSFDGECCTAECFPRRHGPTRNVPHFALHSVGSGVFAAIRPAYRSRLPEQAAVCRHPGHSAAARRLPHQNVRIRRLYNDPRRWRIPASVTAWQNFSPPSAIPRRSDGASRTSLIR
jgi:hypothetical protein